MRIREFLQSFFLKPNNGRCWNCKFLDLNNKQVLEEYLPCKTNSEQIYYFCCRQNRYISLQNERCNDFET